MSTSKMIELARQISENAAKLDAWYEEQGMDKPSFDIDTPRSYPYPRELHEARDGILSAATDLRNLVLGPSDALRVLIEGHTDLVSLHAIYKFGIADSFPIDGKARFKDIARVTGLSEPVTVRLLRHAMMHRIFREPEPGYVAHTAASLALIDDDILNDYAGVAVEELWKAATRVVDALQSWPSTTDVTQTAYALSNETGDHLYVELGKDTARAKRFANSLRVYENEQVYMKSTVLSAFDWASLGTATVVDIGGFEGIFCVTLAEAFPQLSFVVEDIEQFMQLRKPLDPAYDKRIRFVGCSTLQEQPVRGADVYYFRWIMHTWPDKYCVLMMRALIPALKKGARVLMHEYTLPDISTMTTWKEKRLRNADLAMMEVMSSQERTLAQWTRLFAQADPRFKVNGVIMRNPALPLMEIVWMGGEAKGENGNAESFGEGEGKERGLPVRRAGSGS